ncbi:PREDICTED: CKLF-like MARVEL transmembrane domain-containing protein 7 [Chaetura pelagica]|uniref:CKLF-like MARVEL transmembrane domain-containing protein 7 n=1 Tax=Chaetura pelagica TaxID=8897 RepID=UPI000523327D|nr:PREDICTED: CKLF-like MARVEL transmembrane domain-containing protein 7 [Chaetura pelagica]
MGNPCSTAIDSIGKEQLDTGSSIFADTLQHDCVIQVKERHELTGVSPAQINNDNDGSQTCFTREEVEGAGTVHTGRRFSEAHQQISLLIGFISVNNSPWTDYSAYSYFQIVTMCDLVMILFFYIIHIFRFYRKLTCVSWPLAEFLHYLIGTILLLIASIVAASKSYNLVGLVAGATFGFLATTLCVLSMWSSYKVSCITQSTSKYHA